MQKQTGALDQVLSILLPNKGGKDIILVLDADTILGSNIRPPESRASKLAGR